MEFFKFIRSNQRSDVLQRTLTVENLARYCALIDQVLEYSETKGRVYCLWGEFAVNREEINGGVRFSLPGCPNNIAWSITAGEAYHAGRS